MEAASQLRPDLITLDSHSRLFLSCGSVDPKALDWDSTERRLTFTVTGSQPLVIHANGKEKSYLHNLIGMWREPA